MLARPGKETELQRQLVALVAPTRKEEGCIQYDLHQDNGQPGRFVFFENWTSRELLDKHLASPHLTAFLNRADELLAEPPRILACTKLA